jgi:PBSX family phage terminase large subunit
MLLTGAAGGGKSALAAAKLHAFCIKYPGATGLMMRKTRQSMTNSTVLFFEREVAQGTCTHVGSKNRFEYPNGSILAYGGMADDEQREQIRSIGQQGGVDMVWMEEANRFTEDDFNEILARLRGTAAPWRQVMLTTNPGAPTHWIKRRLIDQGEARTYYSQASDNRHNPDEYRSILEHMTGVAYQRLVLGQWVQAEGAVYSTWDASRMVVDDDQLREWGVIEGYASRLCVLNRKTVRKVLCLVDWGFTAPGVILVLAVDNDDRVFIVYQVIRTGKLIEWWIDQAKEIRQHFRPSAFVCDPAEPAYILQFRQAGLLSVEADNDIEAGIQAVQKRMVIDVHGRPRLAVRKGSCVDPDPLLVAAKKPSTLEEEIAGYQWQDSPDGKPVKELPVMVNDHALDALRYGCYYLANLGAVTLPKSRQREPIA